MSIMDNVDRAVVVTGFPADTVWVTVPESEATAKVDGELAERIADLSVAHTEARVVYVAVERKPRTMIDRAIGSFFLKHFR